MPAEPEVVLQIMSFCEADQRGPAPDQRGHAPDQRGHAPEERCTGYIDYTKFANFLNWKQLLPSGIGLCAGLGVVGVRDLVLEWMVCGIWSGWCAGYGVGVGGVRDLE